MFISIHSELITEWRGTGCDLAGLWSSLLRGTMLYSMFGGSIAQVKFPQSHLLQMTNIYEQHSFNHKSDPRCVMSLIQ